MFKNGVACTIDYPLFENTWDHAGKMHIVRNFVWKRDFNFLLQLYEYFVMHFMFGWKACHRHLWNLQKIQVYFYSYTVQCHSQCRLFLKESRCFWTWVFDDSLMLFFLRKMSVFPWIHACELVIGDISFVVYETRWGLLNVKAKNKF